MSAEGFDEERDTAGAFRELDKKNELSSLFDEAVSSVHITAHTTALYTLRGTYIVLDQISKQVKNWREFLQKNRLETTTKGKSASETSNPSEQPEPKEISE